jgi:3-hydroxyisobutyrate dehydrogenase-like beta-hydroxyacid dehydrogenase
MGAPLVARLVAAGHVVLATDIRPGRRREAEQAGARWAADTAQVAADSSVVLTVLPGSPELEELVAGSGRLLAQMGDRTTWVDLTSASFELGQDCARRARRHGVAYLDAPVGGGVAAMRDGAVALYVGGDGRDLAAATPMLRSFARTIHHVGGPGTGYLAKLLINLLWFGQATLTTEALLLAQRHGLPPGRMREVLAGSAGDSAFAAQHLPALLDGDYLGDFGLDRCVEELDSIEHSADRAGTPHALTSVIAELHRSALRHYGTADGGTVDGELLAAAWLEEQAGSRLARDENRSQPGSTTGLLPAVLSRWLAAASAGTADALTRTRKGKQHVGFFLQETADVAAARRRTAAGQDTRPPACVGRRAPRPLYPDG